MQTASCGVSDMMRRGAGPTAAPTIAAGVGISASPTFRLFLLGKSIIFFGTYLHTMLRSVQLDVRYKYPFLVIARILSCSILANLGLTSYSEVCFQISLQKHARVFW